VRFDIVVSVTEYLN